MAMRTQSKITWTDFSGGNANFVLRGKAKGDCEVSPGCLNCYVGEFWKRYPKIRADQTTFSEEKLKGLSRWKPPAGPYRRGPSSKPVDFQILSKRAKRMANLFQGTKLPANIWMGTTTENQSMADARIPELLKLDAPIRFLSIEPQLEPVTVDLSGISWVICGAESGAKRRPFHKQWASDLHEQCQQAGVPFFFKQGSHRYPGRDDLLDGQHIKQWPIGEIR
jgi:protein gp37